VLLLPIPSNLSIGGAEGREEESRNHELGLGLDSKCDQGYLEGILRLETASEKRNDTSLPFLPRSERYS